jgi:hypothetical protein
MPLLDRGVDYLDLVDLTTLAEGASTIGNAGHLAASIFGGDHGGVFSQFSAEQETAKLGYMLMRSNAAKFILFSELFWRAEEGALARIAQATRDLGFAPKYVIYLREQVGYLVSAAIQSLKSSKVCYPLDDVVT